MKIPEDWIQLGSLDALDSDIKAGKDILIFKNSTRCPISMKAFYTFSDFFENRLSKFNMYVYYYIDVVRNRELSREVAQLLDVEHESPQLIYMRGKVVVWSVSHGQITSGRLKEALVK